MPITYKCPNCGAAMEFDSTAQKLKCPSCQMEMDVQDYEKQYGHLYSDAEAGENAQSAQSEEQKHMYAQDTFSDRVNVSNTSTSAVRMLQNTSTRS